MVSSLMTGASDTGLVTVVRLFGASPGLAAPVYRLKREDMLPPWRGPAPVRTGA
jgi:hypothetical protein